MTAFEPMLTAEERAFVASARRAVLSTVRPNGLPRLAPICFVLADQPDDDGRAVLYSPLDEKPKRFADPRRLARVTDIATTPAVEVLVDRWSEDWSELGWVRLSGSGSLVEPDLISIDEHRSGMVALRDKYPQYRDQALEARPLVRISVSGVARWGNLALPRNGPRSTPSSGWLGG